MKRFMAFAIVVPLSLIGALPAAAGTDEGIEVHGHWKIEIFEPDGTPVSVTEFENALGPMGGSFISHALIGNYSVGAWMVRLFGPPAGPNPCDNGSGGDIQCEILEVGTTWSGSWAHSSNLVVQWSGAMVLSGSVTAAYSTTINQVNTLGKACGSNIDPDTCGGMTSGVVTNELTMATLGSPPSVAAGQIIQVTITITLS